MDIKISVFYDHIAEAALQEKESIEKIAELVSSYGITGVEIENTRLMKERENVLKILDTAGLSVSCMYGFFDFAHESSIQRGLEMVDLADKLHIKKIMPIPGFLRRYEFLPGIYHIQVDKLVKALRNICAYAEEKGIKVVLEDFDGRMAPFANARQLKHFLDQIPELYCAFDTGNFLFSEEDSYEVLPLFLDRIGHVHCKDRSFRKNEGEKPLATIKGRDMYSRAVGSGCIRMQEIVKEILAKGYADYFAIEHFGSLKQLEDMRESAAFLSNLANLG